jgi:acyl transferase domain-containing protein/surfactin synthase thioesterase subunit/acyl carrier protein
VKSGDERILTLLQQARHQLETERRRRSEPIAIVGMACRLPGGAASPAKLWELLLNRVDATGDVPLDRWDAEALYDPDPTAPGKAYVRRGAFLERIDGFDPQVFGISPREALGLDPQQRLLLEVTWEALENANIPTDSLNGTATGVWVGLCMDDYARRSITSGDLTLIDAYNSLGNTRSIAAGRIAYVLGLQGPAIQLDTACSSSLVAIHLAVQSLRAGECNLALVGGVNLMSSPETTIGLCKLNALSKDGRCKTFDASADGYGRGEGCGVVVLKRLSEARADGDPIAAVIRGTAINHDGRSNGLTAPNGAAQESVIRAALADAGVSPGQLGYVEVHGTGTLLGDPIEVLALGRVFGAAKSRTHPLHLGSLKTNVGHLEGAAGVAGVIKAALCVAHGRIAPHLHFLQPNPRIPWSELAVRVATDVHDWSSAQGARIAGVSSFGISGTNAHIVLEEPPAGEPLEPAPTRTAELITLSAKTSSALRPQAAALAEHLQAQPELGLADVAYSLIVGRATFDHRWACAAGSRSALIEALRGAARAESIMDGEAIVSSAPKVAFVFPGQGSQWLGMGRRLLEEETAFRDAIAACDAAIRAEAGWSILDELHASEGTSRLRRVEVVQPLLFAVQVALAAVWKAWGVKPYAVVGHSMGEVAAACVSGALSLSAGAAIICRRSALLGRISGQGEMALVELSMEEATHAIAGLETRISVAASNGQRSTVLSGSPPAIAEVLAKLEARAVFCRRIKVDVASHSPQVDPLLGDLLESLHDLAPQLAGVTMHSTVTGEPLTGTELTARYWADNLRLPVRFEQSIRWLISKGVTLFVEISPHPLLVTAMEDIRKEVGAPGTATGSLRREQPERLTLLESLGVLFKHGHALDAQSLFDERARAVTLPNYAWQREKYWLEPPAATRRGAVSAQPLLGARSSSPMADAVFDSVLSIRDVPWLADHRVAGRAVLPGAAIVELLRMAGDEHGAGTPCEVRGLVIDAPLTIADRQQQLVQVVLTEGGTRGDVYSQAAGGNPADGWTRHASATLDAARDGASSSIDVHAVRARCGRAIDIAKVYSACASVGLDYGPAFRGLRSLWAGSREALAEVELASGLDGASFGLHPAILDAALQAAFGVLDIDAMGHEAWLPFEIDRYVLHRIGATSLLVHAQALDAPSSEGLLLDLTLAEPDGAVVGRVSGLHLRRVNAPALARAQTPQARAPGLYRVEWRETASPARAHTLEGRWLIVSTGDDVYAESVAARLRDSGVSARRIGLQQLKGDSAEHVLCAWDEAGDAEGAMRAACDALDIVHALAEHAQPPHLWWVTRAAVAVESGDDVAVAGSSVWGVGRTLARERPELSCTLLDLEPGTLLVDVLIREFGAGDHEDQVAWRGGRRHVARLTRAPDVPETPVSENYQLAFERSGTLDNLSLRSTERRAPHPGEIELEVCASGLNFRDVMGALGMYPGELGALGSECAGIVTQLGYGVNNIALGDRMMALTTGSFSRYVTLDARLAAPVPEGLSWVQAATTPVAFLTAWYALHDLANLKAGETLLVHAAAGGVGMAAVQVAQQIGAKVLATASPPKWAVVRSLGVTEVASSRDLAFVERFRPPTAQVDVVLNSLGREFNDASLSLLSHGGRFVEMGKTDIRQPGEVARAHPGVHYVHFDLGDAGVERIAAMFADIGRGLASGELARLPVRVFAMSEAESAFRLLARARHVGKLALLPVGTPSREPGTVLVTGGLGALGIEVARTLAERGTRHLVLLGRRGIEAPGAAQEVAALEALGARVSVVAGDVTVEADIAKALALIHADLPLRGVVHAAGALDDGLLDAQTAERFVNVMAPKVRGAWNLHTLTRSSKLDFFVLFSSLAGTFGSPGQAGYAAANSFLDALAAHRRALGLPGSSLAWGTWAQRGLAAALDLQLKARLSREGIEPLAPSEGRALFEQSLRRPEAYLAPASINLRQVAKAFDTSIPPLWQALLRKPSKARAPGATGAENLAALPAEQRLQAVSRLVRGEVARVLSLSGEAGVQPNQPLKELGLDSLMAVELRNGLARRLAMSLPATLIFHHPTASAIAQYVAQRMLDASRAPGSPPSEVAHCECLNPSSAARVRLFGFHDAGGSASLFEPFCRLASDGVEVHAVSHARGGPVEAAAGERYLREAVSYIRGLSGLPYVLFGHSLGGLFAWRVLKALVRERVRLPGLLVLSASVLPPAAERARSAEGLAEIFSVVLGHRAPAAETLRGEFEADFALWASLPAEHSEPVDVPIAAFAGSDDRVATEDTMKAWRQATTAGFSLSEFPGGHFYVSEDAGREAMLGELRERILQLLAAGVYPRGAG